MADEDKTVYIGIELDKQAQSSFNTSVDATAARLKTAFSNAQNAINSDTEAVDELRKSLNEAADEADNLQKASSGGGGFGVEGLRRTGGALTQLGLGEIGAPISRIGDIAQVGKEFGKITEAAKPLVEGLATVGDATAPLTVAMAGLGGSMGVVLTAALPLAAAVAGVAIAVKQFSDILAEGKKAIDAAIESQTLYYTAIQTGSADSIQKQIKALEDAKAIADNLANDARNALIKTLTEAANSGDILQETAAAIAAGPLKAELDKQTEASNKAAESIAKLKEALDKLAATDNILKAADDAKKAKAEEQADAALSVEAAKAKLKAQQDLLQQDFEAYTILEQSGDTSQKVKDQMEALKKEMDALTTEIGRLNNQTIPAAQHVKDLADAEKDHAKALQDANKVMKDETAAVQKQHADMANAVQKADADIEKINEQSAQKKIDIERKYQDALVSAAEKALQSAQDALQRLHDEREKLTIDFGRGEVDATRKAQYDDLTAQIKGQEEQTKAYREHLQRLQDIQRNAQQQQAQDILDRNFLAIFQNQLSTRNAMEGENTSFGRSEQERSIAQQQAASDAERQRAFDRQQRLISYQQANADAQRQYQLQLRDNQIAEQRAIAQARQAKTVELSDLSHATSQALAIRHQSLVAELQLITQGEQQKLAIQAQFYQRAVQLINNAVNSIGRSAGGATNAALMHATALQTTQIIGQTFGVRS